MYDVRWHRRSFSFRLGLQNAYDAINGRAPYRITGATGFNATTRQPNLIYRYAEPATVNFTVTTQL
jgi:hypothetical protein